MSQFSTFAGTFCGALCPVWDVDSRITRLLCTSLYEAYVVEHGAGRADALQCLRQH
jgi:hypothetical protein